MNCKNCELPLRTDYSFCSNCGAKIIRNRLTLKNLWYDVTERYFNVDNTFLRTFWHLFTKPQDVIAGYINGTRKKYLNPISYFAIAITLGGLFIYIYTEFFPDAMDFQSQFPKKESLNEGDKFAIDFQKKINGYMIKYQSLIYVLILPFLALISKLVFINKKQFNLSEHLVINIYSYSQMSIIINTVYILILWNSKLFYYVSLGNSIFQIGFFTWVFYKIFNLNLKQIILKLLFFLLIFAVVFFIIIVVSIIYFAVFTDTFQNMKDAQQAML